MFLYNLESSDIADLLALLSGPQLTVSGAQVQRVAQLQHKLMTLQPAECVTKAQYDLQVQDYAALLETWKITSQDLERARDALREATS